MKIGSCQNKENRLNYSFVCCYIGLNMINGELKRHLFVGKKYGLLFI